MNTEEIIDSCLAGLTPKSQFLVRKTFEEVKQEFKKWGLTDKDSDVHLVFPIIRKIWNEFLDETVEESLMYDKKHFEKLKWREKGQKNISGKAIFTKVLEIIAASEKSIKLFKSVDIQTEYCFLIAKDYVGEIINAMRKKKKLESFYDKEHS